MHLEPNLTSICADVSKHCSACVVEQQELLIGVGMYFTAPSAFCCAASTRCSPHRSVCADIARAARKNTGGQGRETEVPVHNVTVPIA
jgi:hypothetical protein